MKRGIVFGMVIVGSITITLGSFWCGKMIANRSSIAMLSEAIDDTGATTELVMEVTNVAEGETSLNEVKTEEYPIEEKIEEEADSDSDDQEDNPEDEQKDNSEDEQEGNPEDAQEDNSEDEQEDNLEDAQEDNSEDEQKDDQDSSEGYEEEAISVVDSYASAAFEQLNQKRIEAGCEPLVWSESLYESATIRAKEIVESCSHTRPNGERCFTVIKVAYQGAGENIAAGQWSADWVVESWMDSEEHRKHILEPRYTQSAIACVYVPGSQYEYYWVQIFIG